MRTRDFGIVFGAMSDPIKKQILKQGFSLKEDEVKKFQRQADIILELRFADLLNDTMYNKIREKLFKRILAHIKKLNPPLKH